MCGCAFQRFHVKVVTPPCVRLPVLLGMLSTTEAGGEDSPPNG